MAKYAVVFSGQGSERVGMFNDLVRESNLLSKLLMSIGAVLPNNIKEIISSTDRSVIAKNNQILLLLFHYLMSHYVVDKIGRDPEFCMGHSFGQFSALVSSGAIALSDMIGFIVERAKILNDPSIQVKASFKSIHGMTIERFRDFYKTESLLGNVELALHNQLEQVVVAATHTGEELLKKHSDNYGYVIKDINVSKPYHTQFMDEYNDHLQPYIRDLSFATPNIPVFMSNSKTPAVHKDALEDETKIQMIKPVYWYESVLAVSEKVDAFVIVDPSDTQFKIIKRISPARIHTINNFGAVKMIEKRGV